MLGSRVLRTEPRVLRVSKGKTHMVAESECTDSPVALQKQPDSRVGHAPSRTLLAESCNYGNVAQYMGKDKPL